MKQAGFQLIQYFGEWHWLRWLRLGLSLLVAFQAWELKDGVLWILAALLAIQAISNTGCASGSCKI
jgi:hypothetical protein